jgi:6-pyruvoyltetrahydropterin/6-carboxytetrahydropterin synthase
MFRLTREVRFGINSQPDEQLARRATNSYGGFPSLRGFGAYLTLQVTVAGDLEPASNYLVNIKQIDAIARKQAIPFVARAISGQSRTTPERAVAGLLDGLRNAWPGLQLESLRLWLSPFLSYWACAREIPMVRLSQKFEFSATHRLHNPALGPEENVRTFGKCNNPHGHGHNYELQVTVAGEPNESGVLIDVPEFETIVAAAVVERFDHKNLNIELPEFRELIPTVENIARVIYGLLKPRFDTAKVKLASVTVWETPKTWCEYSESDE